MWNQKMKELLYRFFDAQPATEGNDTTEQTHAFQDPEATIALDDADVFNAEDGNLSIDTLRSMHFGLPSTDTPTAQFDGERYREVGKLGEGGMASVWKMKDNQLLRDVALKQLHSSKAGSNYEQENFIVEAQITAQLQHPGIVPIHDLQIDDSGRIYFTMREIKGQTLEDIIQAVHRVSNTRWNTTHSGWNLRRLIDALENICQTVAYAHSRGVIHQDLKPANIMVGDYGEVLVVDWGVARVRSLYTHSPSWVRIKASKEFIEYKKTSVSGTPRYMAPEQIYENPQNIDGRADVFALGVILFYILTQDKPFLGSMKEIFEQKKYHSASIKQYFIDEPDTLSVPTELVDICERAMAHDPVNRFKDAKEMQLAIRSWLDGARQEEEARLILREVSILQQKIHSVNDLCKEIIPQLNTPSINDTILSEEWWKHWLILQDHRHQIEQIRDIIYQKAQGAILYAPHLPEIYDRLVELEYQDYLEAVLEGNHKSISKTERRFNAYLQHLPHREQERWKNIRSVDLASLQSQKSHGVNIERSSEQSTLIDLLKDHRWISIVGLAGVGKTHLAWQTASEWCKEQSWEVLFCDVTDSVKPAGLLQRLTTALGVQQTGSDPFELIIHILNGDHPKFERLGESTFLIIDNAESLHPDSWNVLSTIVDRCPSIRLIITTRKAFNHSNNTQYNLHPMSLINAIELFSQHCKQQLPSWSLTEGNRNQVLQIVNMLDRIPLAIELAGARTAEFSLLEMLTRLQERFSLLKSNSDNQPTLQMALSWSCTSLSDLEKQTLYQLSVIPSAFTLTLAEAIADIPRGNSLSDVLDVLTQHSLINREYLNGNTQYTMLKSIRDYAVTQTEPMLIQATHHRMAKYLVTETLPKNASGFELTLLEAAALHGAPKDAMLCCQKLLTHLNQFGPLITGLEIAIQFLHRTDLSDDLKQPIQLLKIDFLIDSGNTSAVLDDLMTISAAQPRLQIKEPSSEIKAVPFPIPYSPDTTLRNQAYLEMEYAQLIQHHEWDQAFSTASQLYQHPSISTQHVHQWFEDFSNGGQLRLALGIGIFLSNKLTNHPEQLLSLLIDVAVLHTRLGNREQAIESYNRALDLAEQQQATNSQARIIGNLGLLYQADGNLEYALRQYLRAHNIFEQLDSKDKLGALDGNIGTIYHEQGNITEALQHFNQAIQLAEHSNNMLNKGVFLGNRAMCLMDLNQLEQAQIDLEEAISLCDRHLEFAAGAFRGELAHVLLRAGKPDLAVSLLKKGEEQVKEHKEQYGKFLCRKASVLYRTHDHHGARSALRDAEKITLDLKVRPTSALQKALTETQKEIPAQIWLSEHEISERKFLAQIALRWAKYESTNTRYPQALHHLEKSLHFFEMLGDKENILNVRYNIAIIYTHIGKLKEAIQIANDTRQQHLIAGNEAAYGIVTNFVGGCHRRLGDIQKALEHHEESLDILGKLNHVQQVSAFEKAGLCCRIMGEYAKALQYLEDALEMALMNNQRTGTLYCNVGLCHNVMGNEDQAIHYYHLGIQELRKIGDRNREALYLGNIANIYARQERYEEARSLYQEVIDISLETGVKANECITRGNFGDLLINIGAWEQSEQELLKAIEIGTEIYPIAANVFQSTLSKLKSLEGKTDEALTILRSINTELLSTDAEEYTKFICVSAEVLYRCNKTTEAFQMFKKATALLEKHAFANTTDVYMTWLKTKDLLESPAE